MSNTNQKIQLKMKPQVVSVLIHAVNDFTAPVDFVYKGYYEKDLSLKISRGAHFPKVSAQGIYYFTNLEDGDYSVTISSPLFVTETINFSVVPGVVPEASVRMKPGYDYKIYGETAFIRGIALDSANYAPAAGVRVLALPRNEEAYTDSAGRFMVYFKTPIDSAGEQISLTFQDAAYQTFTVNVAMNPGDKNTIDNVLLTRV